MKIQWEILLFLFCLNLAFGLVLNLSMAGTNYFSPTEPMDPEDAESHFNATDIAGKWGSTPFSGVPLVGDIFSGFQFFVQNLQFLIDGFPMLLTWMADAYIVDAGAAVAFNFIAWVLRAIYALLISTFFIEFISGRVFTD